MSYFIRNKNNFLHSLLMIIFVIITIKLLSETNLKRKKMPLTIQLYDKQKINKRVSTYKLG